MNILAADPSRVNGTPTNRTLKVVDSEPGEPPPLVLAVLDDKDADEASLLVGAKVIRIPPTARNADRNRFSGLRIGVLVREDEFESEDAARRLRCLNGVEAEHAVVVLPGWRRGEPLAEWRADHPEYDAGRIERAYQTAILIGLPEPDAGPAVVAEEVCVNEAADDPHRLARVIRDAYIDPQTALPGLWCYRSAFYTWDGTRYRERPTFREKEIVSAIKTEFDRVNRVELAEHQAKAGVLALAGGRGRPTRPPEAHKVTTGLVRNVAQALAALAAIDGPDGGEAPFWIWRNAIDPEPTDLIPVANGLVDISGETPVLRPHTPRLFYTQRREFEFDPEADTPTQWARFLGSQWENDPESIDALHEQLGDMIRPTPEIHAIHLWIGPPRSGRSTIRDIATALVGPENVAATSPVALGSSFGLEPIAGKLVAVLGDARTGDTHDSAVMTDRLLRISGHDPVEVNRKGRPILSGVRLRTRLLIISNELPNIRDSSGAIVARYRVLATTRTIPAEDRDPDLSRKLRDELPAVFNLALAGLRRLKARGRFTQPQSSANLLLAAEEIASPVKAFVEERVAEGRLELGDVNRFDIAVSDLFETWKSWAATNGYPYGNVATFGKNLRAAYPHIEKARPRENGGRQVAKYLGIGYRSDPPI